MNIIEKKLIRQNLYENFHNETLLINIFCCNKKISVNILQEYKLLENLVFENSLSEEEIIKNGLAKLTKKYDKHLDLFTVFNNLPAYYYLYNCANCLEKYIIIYGVGESQSGRDVAYVSGVWQIR